MKSPMKLMPLLIMALALYGCGRSRNTNIPSGPVLLWMSPLTATVLQGGTLAFSITVTGSNNTAVIWSITEGAAGGSVSSSGTYTAPDTPGTYHVNAVSQADTAVVTTATVTVPAVTISVLPSITTIGPGRTRVFSAEVGGTVNQMVSWILQEGSAGGTISNGVYTAPATLGTFHVIATSIADPSKSALVSIIVANTSGSFSSTQSMITVSGVEAATLLPGGQVLVAGGCGGEDFLEVGQPDAELYDPVTKSFTTTVHMESPRCRHTATFLPNGKVLVVGGFSAEFDGPASASNSAELYDATTHTFSPTGNMIQARAAHTSTLLPNGKVLIAGGAIIGGWGFPFYGDAIASAEIYDPATNAFTTTGAMGTARFGHTATLLPSGKVLITGGFASAQVNQQATSLASSEAYDPLTGTFSPAGNMTVARGGHTATLLQNGTLLVAGGFATVGPSTTVLSNAELYDASTGVFASRRDMNWARAGQTATLLADGHVLLAGGATASSETLATTELYDPATGTFTGTDSMATPRTGHSATLLQDGTVLISGGEQASGGFVVYLRSAELFTP